MELPADPDVWLTTSNRERPYQDRSGWGKTPVHTFMGSVPVAKKNPVAVASGRSGSDPRADAGVLRGSLSERVLISTAQAFGGIRET